MEPQIDRLNRVIAAAGEIRKAADRMVAMALYLRQRGSDLGDDDRAMLDAGVDQMEEQMRHLR